MKDSFFSPSSRAGDWRLVPGPEPYRAFIPRPLPPEPPLALTQADHQLFEQSVLSLGRLDGLARVLPDKTLFIYMYVRKEALLSSQIEGTQSSLSELLLFESDENATTSFDDVTEVSNYVAAMRHGISALAELPLSSRLFRSVHSVLLQRGRGSEKTPGEFRTSQNWIGGTRPGNAVFVPPPPDSIPPCMSDLERFLNDESEMPLLIRVGLAHAHFESIHPFLDGNGRLGRLLITLALIASGAIQEPLLYLSLYFKENRKTYYELLQNIRTHGAWEDWIRFFLQGVRETADQAAQTATSIHQIFEEDRALVTRSAKGIGTVRLHELMQKIPLLNVARASRELPLSRPTILKALRTLEKLGIIREVTGKHWGQMFRYERYLQILEQGTQPIGG